jgi:hypothetical protein
MTRKNRMYLLVAAAVACAALVVPASALAVPAPDLKKLYLGTSSTSGTEDYQFTAGNSIFPDVTHATSGAFYKLTVTDPNTTVKTVVACAATSTIGSPSDAYTVQAGDPLSTSSSWTFTYNEYSDASCATAATLTASVPFDVAGATSYSDAAGTTAQSLFGAGQTAFLRATGLAAGTHDWSVTWTQPDLTVACAMTTSGNRPDSSASAVLPDTAGTTLQYAPVSGAPNTWNNLDFYDAPQTCPSFGASNEGAWTVTLAKDTKHFVTLPAFNVDGTPPAITITSPADGATFTRGTAVNASYSCTDAVAGVATCAGDVASGSPIDTSTDGVHSFTVNATDNVGNASTQIVSYTVVAPATTTTGTGGAGGTGGTNTTLVTQNALSAPGLTLAGSKSQSMKHHYIKVIASCDQACGLIAGGTVSVPGAAKTFRLKTAYATLNASGTKTLKLKISKKAFKAIRKALGKGKHLKANVTVTAKSTSTGKIRSRSRKIALKP